MPAVFWLFLLALWIFFSGFLLWEGHKLRRQRSKAASHRALFLQIMAKVENSVYLLNQMKDLAPHVPKESLLDSYENCIGLQRQMLVTLVTTPQFGKNPQRLREAFAFASGLGDQVSKTFKLFCQADAEKTRRYEAHLEHERGCYFCSRPYLAGKFSLISIKVSNVPLKVMSCPWCAEEIRTTGACKVLYFEAGKEQLHWSKVPSYDPSQDFWRIYDKLFWQRRNLKVIYAKGDTFDSSSE